MISESYPITVPCQHCGYTYYFPTLDPREIKTFKCIRCEHTNHIRLVINLPNKKERILFESGVESDINATCEYGNLRITYRFDSRELIYKLWLLMSYADRIDFLSRLEH